MDKNQDIIDRIKSTPSIQPPASFTDNVILRLPDKYPGILPAVGSFLNQLYNSALEPDGDRASGLTRRECSFYFFITGFFYLIIGIVILLGLSGVSGDGPLTKWSLVQPLMIIIASFWLSGLGGMLFISDRISMEVAKIATMIYILSVILCGSVVVMLYRMPVLMLSTVILAISGVVMGLLLHQNVSRYQQSPHN